ncbi:MAG: formimidoylglutamase [Phycisphaerales bacterium]|jgi:formiminoglutamase|nr:formimidoylglutamase [Phycisphaerales bacterium]
MIPHTTPGVWPADIPAARFASLVQRERPEGCRVGLLGIPQDIGVRLNNGRPGAAEGPREFRRALARLGVARPDGHDWPRVFDAGDVVPATFDGPASLDNTDAIAALHETHRRISEASLAIADAGLLPFAVGGGHDCTFAFVQGVQRQIRSPMAGLYFDPHLDVRETPGSGMGFRRLIEVGAVDSLSIVGFDAIVNSREHVSWFREQGGQMLDPAGPLQLPQGRPLFVSVDMDSIDASSAPGVSAMNPCGLSPSQLVPWVEAAAAHPRLACFDIMELSPPHDPDGRTARLAAYLFLTFLRALPPA